MFTLRPCGTDLITWLRSIRNSEDYVFCDTETTGFKGQVIDLAVVGTHGQVHYHCQFRPSCPIEPGSQAVHGISMKDLRHAPTFRDEWDHIHEALAGKGIIGWNIAFDGERIEQTAKAWSIEIPQMTGYCLMKEYTKYKWLHRNIKLEAACAREGLDLGKQEHRALGDTLAVYNLAMKLAGPKSDYQRYLDWRMQMEEVPIR